MEINGNYRINDICKMFDISKPTLYKWEKEGKISPPERDWRGWRVYSQRNIEEIRKFIEGQSQQLYKEA